MLLAQTTPNRIPRTIRRHVTKYPMLDIDPDHTYDDACATYYIGPMATQPQSPASPVPIRSPREGPLEYALPKEAIGKPYWMMDTSQILSQSASGQQQTKTTMSNRKRKAKNAVKPKKVPKTSTLQTKPPAYVTSKLQVVPHDETKSMPMPSYQQLAPPEQQASFTPHYLSALNDVINENGYTGFLMMTNQELANILSRKTYDSILHFTSALLTFQPLY